MDLQAGVLRLEALLGKMSYMVHLRECPVLCVLSVVIEQARVVFPRLTSLRLKAGFLFFQDLLARWRKA